MPETLEDYWPDDLAPVEDSAPVAFLKELARALQSKTNGTVRAEVTSNTVEGTVYHSLYLKAPHLGDYGFKVLYLSHPITRDASSPFPIKAQDSFGGSILEFRNLDDLKEWLKPVLTSKEVKAVIRNLRHQSRVTL